MCHGNDLEPLSKGDFLGFFGVLLACRFAALGVLRVSGLGCRVKGLGFRVKGLGLRV